MKLKWIFPAILLLLTDLCFQQTTTSRITAQSAVTPRSGQQNPALRSGCILFSSRRDGNQEVYVIDLATRKEINLTNNAADDGYPRMSPDGRRIAFASNRDRYWATYLMNADGTKPVKLLKDRNESGYPAWASDSWLLNFAMTGPGERKNDIYVSGADGSTLRRLTNHPAEDVHPARSPDGNKVVFASERDGNRRVYMMSYDGSGLVCLTNDRWYSDYPAWSPDGSRIAFASDRDSKDSNRLDIYVMNANGLNVQRLTNHIADDRHPCWSPDGKMLAFVSNRLGDRDIFTINADGSDPKVLVRAVGDDEHPQWNSTTAPKVDSNASQPQKEGFKQQIGRAIKDGLGITEMELRKQLFQQLIADGQINRQDCVEMGETNPMKLLSTAKVDLNGDGIPEIKVSGEQGCAFQGARRGMQWLYRKTGNRYELLGSISAAEKIDLLNTSTNGYRDLNVIYPAGNNYPEFREIFRFDGRRYQEPKQQRSTTAKGSGAGAKPTANANAKPEQGDWATFWPTFRGAVQKRDRAMLRSMMSASFEWAGDGQVSSVQAIKNIDQGLVSWQRLLISVNSGVVNCKPKDGSCWNFSGRQAKRTIKANCLVFEQGVDGHWKWVRLIGD